MAESRLVDELAVRAEVEEAFEKEILMTYHLRRNVSAATAALSALASARNTTRIPVDVLVYSMPIYTSIIHALSALCSMCVHISALGVCRQRDAHRGIQADILVCM